MHKILNQPPDMQMTQEKKIQFSFQFTGFACAHSHIEHIRSLKYFFNKLNFHSFHVPSLFAFMVAPDAVLKN